MHLVAADAVDDVRARFLERARPPDVPLLVEPRRQLHDDGDLFVAFRGALQAGDDRGTGLARYSVCLMASTSGSSAACASSATTGSYDS